MTNTPPPTTTSNKSSNGKRTTSTRSTPDQKSANALAVQRFRDRRKQQIEHLRTENDELAATVEKLKRELQHARDVAPGSTAPTHLAQIEVENYLLKRENEHLRSLAHRCVLVHQGDLVQMEAAQVAFNRVGTSTAQQQPSTNTTPHTLQAQVPASAQSLQPHAELHPAGAHRPSGQFTKINLASMHSTSSREMGLKLSEHQQHHHPQAPVSPSNTSQHSASGCSTVPTPPASVALPFLSSALNSVRNHTTDDVPPLDPSRQPPSPTSLSLEDGWSPSPGPAAPPAGATAVPTHFQRPHEEVRMLNYSSYVPQQDWTDLLNATVDLDPTHRLKPTSHWASTLPFLCVNFSKHPGIKTL